MAHARLISLAGTCQLQAKFVARLMNMADLTNLLQKLQTKASNLYASTAAGRILLLWERKRHLLAPKRKRKPCIFVQNLVVLFDDFVEV